MAARIKVLELRIVLRQWQVRFIKKSDSDFFELIMSQTVEGMLNLKLKTVKNRIQ